MVTNHGPLGDDSISDLFVYSVYAELLADGLVPYRDFGFEYPPLALVPIGIAGGDATALSLLMLGCALGAQEAARALSGPRAAWLCAALPLLAGALVRTRFDLLPAALALAGLVAVVRGRPGLAGAVLGLGTLAKLWPAVAGLVAVAWLLGRGERAAAVRLTLIGAAVVAAGAIPFALAGDFPAAMVEFHLDRPVQIESLPASVLFALGDSYVTGHPVRPDAFKSNGLDGGAADAVALLAAMAQLAALAVVAGLTARRRDADGLLLGVLAATLAFVVLGKVLSPQFLLWLLPLAAVVAARGHVAAPLLLAAAAVLTQVEFPRRYFDLVAEDGGTVALVAVRNVLLLACLATTVAALARSRPRGASASSG